MTMIYLRPTEFSILTELFQFQQISAEGKKLGFFWNNSVKLRNFGMESKASISLVLLIPKEIIFQWHGFQP